MPHWIWSILCTCIPPTIEWHHDNNCLNHFSMIAIQNTLLQSYCSCHLCTLKPTTDYCIGMDCHPLHSPIIGMPTNYILHLHDLGTILEISQPTHNHNTLIACLWHALGHGRINTQNLSSICQVITFILHLYVYIGMHIIIIHINKCMFMFNVWNIYIHTHIYIAVFLIWPFFTICPIWSVIDHSFVLLFHTLLLKLGKNNKPWGQSQKTSQILQLFTWRLSCHIINPFDTTNLMTNISDFWVIQWIIVLTTI